MRTQNLNENRVGDVIGSMFWHGRSWHGVRNRELEFEWSFGRRTTACHAHINFGAGDSDNALQLSLAIPWLFSVYATLCGVWQLKREYEFGAAIHNNSFWLYTGNDPMGSWSKDNAWWDQTHSWRFPWDLEHYTTEILEHKANLPYLCKAVYTERSGKKHRGKDPFERMYISDAAQKTATEIYDYTYTLKSGEVQHRKAAVYADRMTWRARWYPLIPMRLVRTCINVTFDAEVGEKTGSWKGGCVGCGYEMKHGETPLDTLRRMEKERKF